MRAQLIVGICLLIAASSPAFAGDIVASSSQNFQRVEIIVCNNANLDQCPIVYNGPMAAGQSFTSSTGHLCYKRENYPGDVSRGMESNWSCDTNTNDEAETWSID